MTELMTNFKDDILAESMEGRRRYQMITNEDGTVSFADVTEYLQVGSEFGQAEVNAIHRELNKKFDSGDVVDPLAAEETGFAADAKLTGDAIREVNAKTPQIESGFVNVQFSTTVRTYKITFKNPFQEPPVIQLTVYSGQYGAHARAMITGITTIGFEFGTYDNDSSSASGSVYWLAIDKS